VLPARRPRAAARRCAVRARAGSLRAALAPGSPRLVTRRPAARVASPAAWLAAGGPRSAGAATHAGVRGEAQHAERHIILLRRAARALSRTVSPRNSCKVSIVARFSATTELSSLTASSTIRRLGAFFFFRIASCGSSLGPSFFGAGALRSQARGAESPRAPAAPRQQRTLARGRQQRSQGPDSLFLDR